MTQVDPDWLNEHTAEAPAALRERLSRAIPLSASENIETPVDALAEAGAESLATAIAAGSDRSAALDLLAADALITLALLAAAQQSPGDLARTARALRLGRQ